MANIVTGIIDFIGQTTQKQSTDGQKTYYRRELVLNSRRFDPYTGEPTRDNFVLMELSNDRCKELDNFKQGDLVDASYTLDGIKYPDKQTGETKYFTKLSCYKVERHNVANKNSKQTPPAQPAPAQSTPPQPEPFPHQPFESQQPNNGALPF